MLIYHPAYDIYHTSFRVLKILESNTTECLELEKLRILDYILLFPHELKYITVPVDFSSIKRKYHENSYNRIFNRKKVFQQIQHYFQLSLQCLISYGAIDIEKYKAGLVCKSTNFNDVVLKINLDSSFLDPDLLSLFRKSLIGMPTDELKKRAKLN